MLSSWPITPHLLHSSSSKHPPFSTTLTTTHTPSHPSLHFISSSNSNLNKHLSITSTPCFCIPSHSSSQSNHDFEIELARLLALLPDQMRHRLNQHPELHQLIEVVMDLGRKPLARFPSGDFVLSDDYIRSQHLDYATSQVGDFAIDNRAGISRTLHRISAIRNRKGAIIGLTCRVGRAISGSANLLRDLVRDSSSLLLIGPPGVGKTTIIREIARMIADDYKKRVMIVDTSNEIGGDGDIPHPGIGNARRMQVPNTDMQHKVLIEAVENHMPQVIVIDEIGTKLEAMAASTIAQRGIQLVATAHGVTIENLVMNPSLEMLVGGIQSVTLGDEEASRRGGPKTVLERKGPSTFTSGVEIISKTELRIHRNLEATVDALLSGRSPMFEVRKINSQGPGPEAHAIQQDSLEEFPLETHGQLIADDDLEINGEIITGSKLTSYSSEDMLEQRGEPGASVLLYVYGIMETSVIQGVKHMKVDDLVKITDNISEADAMLALQSKLKKNARIQAVAKSHDIPVFMTKTSSSLQITKAIRALMDQLADGPKDVEVEDMTRLPERIDALEETRLAIEQVVIPKGKPVKLLSRPPPIITLQIELVQKYQLQWEKVGKEPNVRLLILPLQDCMDGGKQASGVIDTDIKPDDNDLSDEMNGSVYKVDRLPLLPDQS